MEAPVEASTQARETMTAGTVVDPRYSL